MINELNVKIFDYIFSTNVGLKGNYLENANTEKLCSELDNLINKICEVYDFWNEYKLYFNDNCVKDASSSSGYKYIYNGFPKMKLNTKKDYLKYKMIQLKTSINNNGEFSQNEFEKLTDNIINVGKKEILDYCEKIGIIEYLGKVFISADNYPAIAIIYDNIKAVLHTSEENQPLTAKNIIVVNGNGNRFENIEQNNNLKNSDDEIFNLVLNKLDLLEKEGISKEKLKVLEDACKNKDKNKVINFLKDVASGAISSLIATGILVKLGIQ